MSIFSIHTRLHYWTKYYKKYPYLNISIITPHIYLTAHPSGTVNGAGTNLYLIHLLLLLSIIYTNVTILAGHC